MIRSRVFELLAILAARHPWKVVAVATALTLVSLGLATTIEVKTNFKDTLGPEDPMAIQQAYMEENFPAASAVMIAIEGPDDRLVEVAKEIEWRMLAKHEQVRSVYLEQPVDFFVSHGPLYTPTDDLRIGIATFSRWEGMLQSLLADPSLLGLMRVLEHIGLENTESGSVMVTSRVFGRTLLGQGPWDGIGVQTGIQVDTAPLQERAKSRIHDALRAAPLPQSEENVQPFLQRSEQVLSLMADVLDQGERLTPEEFSARVLEIRELDYRALAGEEGGSRYTISDDGSMLTMEVVSHQGLANVEHAMAFSATVEEVLDEVRKMNADITLHLTGFPVMIAEENGALLSSFGLVTVLGFIGILGVFVIGFERVALPSLSAIPLLMGMAWTFGLQAIVYGDITLFSLAFPVLLLGVGIDFAIHIISAYSEWRSQGQEPEEAMRSTFETIGPGLITGGVTTAGAFLVMLLSTFYGLRAMGFTAGMGVLMALLSMATVLPAILVLWDRRQKGKGELLPNVPFGFLGSLARHVQQHRFAVLALFLATTVVMGWNAAKVKMDTNYMHSLPQELPSVVAQNTILDRFGMSNDSVMILADNLEHAERIRVRAQEAGTVAQVISADLMVPDPAEQALKRPLLEQGTQLIETITPSEAPVGHDYDEADLDELEGRVATLKGAVLDLSLSGAVLYGDETNASIGRLRDHINRIDRRVDPANASRFQYLDSLLQGELNTSLAIWREAFANTSITEEDLPPQILERLRGVDGKWVVIVNATGDVWDPDYRDVFLRELRTTGGEVAGLVPAIHRMMTAMLSEVPKMTLYIFGAVVLLVGLDLRRVRGTLLALSPLVVGMVWTLGIMGIMGWSFNILSVIAVPMVVGIGIDDGVHLYHRIAKERSLAPALEHSGKAVTLTSLTTAIGFGSLMLSIHPGFASLGLVATLGVLCCLVVSLLLLPALVAIFDEQTLRPEQP